MLFIKFTALVHYSPLQVLARTGRVTTANLSCLFLPLFSVVPIVSYSLTLL